MVKLNNYLNKLDEKLLIFNLQDILKSIHKKHGKLRTVFADKCIDNKGYVIYLHMGRGTVKMIGTYKKPNRTTHKQWIKFAKKIVGE